MSSLLRWRASTTGRSTGILASTRVDGIDSVRCSAMTAASAASTRTPSTNSVRATVCCCEWVAWCVFSWLCITFLTKYEYFGRLAASICGLRVANRNSWRLCWALRIAAWWTSRASQEMDTERLPAHLCCRSLH